MKILSQTEYLLSLYFHFNVAFLLTTLTYYLTLLWISLQSSVNLEEGNKLRMELGQALNKADYQTALVIYDSIHNSRISLSPQIRLQVAHAAIEENDTATVQQICEYVLRSHNPDWTTVAYNQLGVMEAKQKNYIESLLYFKKAIEAKPDYKLAVYNYELISKKYPPNVAQNLQDKLEEKITESGITPQQSEEKEDILENTTPPQMGRERALQLLDAMRTNEGQGYSFKRKQMTKSGENDW